ncbi:MAG: ATP synthase subunit I [Pyrinomonadaceae bacterium]
MSDDLDPSQLQTLDAPVPSNRRILVIMAIAGFFGAVAGAVAVSAGFGGGILLGTAFAFLNYLWLQRSLKTIFASARTGERPRMLVGKYFLRFIVLGLAVAVIYITGWVPIVALLLGMAGFGFATVIDGFIRIFTGILGNKEL